MTGSAAAALVDAYAQWPSRGYSWDKVSSIGKTPQSSCGTLSNQTLTGLHRRRHAVAMQRDDGLGVYAGQIANCRDLRFGPSDGVAEEFSEIPARAGHASQQNSSACADGP